ncbi:hydroxymethylglutaryl-CoA reductase, degradative [Myroides odoratus]|uniref:3-hydroxy-3-methylglutaryl coenzyme A reductase n=1 Tax=Myroides odoratus TaxID=256 RepID=A0A9Q7E8T1_MYROD|nr:hydroxymethylglutaryl-CoA reductase, degradative [Myroides odoratus]EHQ42952.1 3-hydroxy-3-methylglutaryl-coenzyme A reductase [Myroides odoratus DSM 2801]EKB07533.1 hydroxymethylglutaryl-CoA reductase, degradative [Myroides odoratus CIP 103059]QQU00302.1 hydroxymethylglutaryl-CoA reductase, degradative [Myroides odoratus]WQD57470.1 hydroxymethylglutaryl-CoA reductase, degradative [Myroides odoratus]STZ30220.1 3-hydroxy-3-methylglutaryl-coenzyme A reductase [Myroides odoratus]
MIGSINGFSKLNKEEKINWIAKTYLNNQEAVVDLIKQYWNSDEELQKLHDEFIENTITNFYLPLGVAPNFLINATWYTIPMVIEESSVVAAASKAAKFWADRGGFKASILNTEKIGQVHFIYKGEKQKLEQFIESIQGVFLTDTFSITQNMQKRGGGILSITLRDKTDAIPNYYQLHVTFETKDSMGANFINSCLEQMATTLKREALQYAAFTEDEKAIDVVMSILSNYVPNCVVRAEVSCPVEELKSSEIQDPVLFAEKFVQAVRIAEIEPFRAVTHNKGVMNGVDAVVLATGNDFRAIEAGVHAYASRNGQYSSLSHASIEAGIFRFWIDLPLAVGTVGGLTSLHPMVKIALQMLQKPSATQLMQIIAVAGLAQNFAAVKSLTTTGIQQGHMKMHLMNILNQFKATDEERVKVVTHFEKNVVSHSAVVELLETLRK